MPGTLPLRAVVTMIVVTLALAAIAAVIAHIDAERNEDRE
jgi:hypothetical protein